MARPAVTPTQIAALTVGLVFVSLSLSALILFTAVLIGSQLKDVQRRIAVIEQKVK